jgi:hypothetical protein
MLAHKVVLLTPTKSSRLTQLLSCQHLVPISPLNATLVNRPASVDYKRLTAKLNPLDATLTKTRGGGRCSLRTLQAAGSGVHRRWRQQPRWRQRRCRRERPWDWEDQSDRNACMTSTRAARAAGSADATTAAASRMNAEPITGRALGMRTSRK